MISVSSLIYGYASYQATYFKDAEIIKLKSNLEEANTKLLRIDVLENQVKELEASLAAKSAAKAQLIKPIKASSKKIVKKVTPTKKVAKKTKAQIKKIKEKKPVKNIV